MMGDTNAVSVLELDHRRQLLSAGMVRTESLLLPDRPLPQGKEFGDVKIDDLSCISLERKSLHIVRGPLEHATCTDSFPCQLPSQKELRLSALSFGERELDGIAGTLGFSMCRRTSPMYVTLTGSYANIIATASGVAFLAALVCGIAPLLQADLRASHRLELLASDAMWLQ